MLRMGNKRNVNWRPGPVKIGSGDASLNYFARVTLFSKAGWLADYQS